MAEKKQKKDKTDESDARVVSKSPEEEATLVDASELPFDLSAIDPKTIAKADAMLEGTGFSIAKLANWANEQHVKTELIIKNMPTKDTVEKGIKSAINDLARDAAARQREIIEKGGMPQGGSGMGLAQMLQLVGGGGGEDEEMKKLQREMFRVNIDGMKSQMNMSNAITSAIVQKITGKAIGDTVAEIVNK